MFESDLPNLYYSAQFKSFSLNWRVLSRKFPQFKSSYSVEMLNRCKNLNIKLFTRNDETWATAQKMENQFRTKEYDMKTAEMIAIPDQHKGGTDLEPLNTENLSYQPALENSDVLETPTKIPSIIKPPDIETFNRNGRSKKVSRKAADYAKRRIKELAGLSLLSTQN